MVGATAATAIITAKESARTVPRTTLLFVFFTSFLHQLINNSVPLSEKQLSLFTILKHGLVTEVRHSFRGEVTGLGEEPVRKVLKSLGLTEKEAEVYIFLAKHGVQRSREIGKRIKTDRSEVYRILKSLQAKGLVEATLEAPARFTSVPFETILDSFIKSKRDEAASVETAKKELLSYFEKFSKPAEPVPEKFVVIEGSNKIYPKILQMMKETKSQLSAVATVPGLVRADQFGIFDTAFTHPLKSKIQFRFLTDLSEQNLNAMKTLLKRTPKTGFNFRGRNPDLGLQLAPRMVIKDDEEIIFFITPRNGTTTAEQDDVCLWTNCKALVQSFTTVFEDLWRNATDIERKIVEIETGKPTPQTYFIIGDAQVAKNRYDTTLHLAKKEIIMMTSSAGLIGLCKNTELLKELAVRGVSVRIMAPITDENLKAVQQLSECCEIRHVPLGYSITTIVDGQTLFQLKSALSDQEKRDASPCFENMFFTTDYEYLYKIKSMLNNIWKSACAPSTVTLESTGHSLFRMVDSYIEEEEPLEKLTEKDVVDKIINAQRIPLKGDPSKYTTRLYGSIAQAVIHPPDYFNLPDMMIWIFHNNKQSSFGAEDMLIIYLMLETPFGHTFMPVAHITDNPKSVPHRKAVFAGTPAAQNIQVVKRDELQVRVQGNTLFAGWTVQIPLIPPKHTLPPSCILFEGYSELRTGIFKTRTHSGRKQTYEYNGFGAFVTFFHPSSKYAGPGTDGILLRDVVFTAIPPSTE
jgi:sugar-specific transcriptional regulator TrmB